MSIRYNRLPDYPMPEVRERLPSQPILEPHPRLVGQLNSAIVFRDRLAGVTRGRGTLIDARVTPIDMPTGIVVSFGAANGSGSFKLTWGTGGTIFQIDQLLGQATRKTIGLHGSFARLETEMSDATPADILVQASACLGEVGPYVFSGQELGPSNALGTQTIAAGAAGAFPIPLFCTGYRFVRDQSATTPFMTEEGAQFDTNVAAGQECPWIEPIGAGNVVNVTNNGVAAAIFTAVYRVRL
jgi:hypothetical protein